MHISEARLGRQRARIACAYGFALWILIMPATSLAQARAWLTGTVIEIVQGHTDTGAVSTTTTNTPPGHATAVDTGGGVIVASDDRMPSTSTTVTTPTGEDYTDYAIRAGDKLFVIRPDPVRPKEGRAGRWFHNIGPFVLGPTASRQSRSVPVTIPVNVGDKVAIAPLGDRASIRYGNREYACTVVRQLLLSSPEKQDQPQSGVPTAEPAPSKPASPDYDPNAPRPTLRREQ